jgi:hypothetical protein
LARRPLLIIDRKVSYPTAQKHDEIKSLGSDLLQ